MGCLTPLTLKKEQRPDKSGLYGSITNVVPCGKCPNCLKRRQSGWIFRLLQEKKISSSSSFLTLTYDDNHLPFSDEGYPTLDKRDYQKFLKRLRKLLTSYDIYDNPLKYYAVGEYGTQTHRPHYHAILFNLPTALIDNPEIVLNTWQKGHVRIDECNVQTIAYVTKYLNKRSHEKIDGDDRQREFSLMSKKMGLNYLSPAIIKYYSENMLPYLVKEGGEKVSMPRYYKEKIFSEDQQKELAKMSLEFAQANPLPFDSFHHEAEYIRDQFRKVEKMANLNRNVI